MHSVSGCGAAKGRGAWGVVVPCRQQFYTVCAGLDTPPPPKKKTLYHVLARWGAHRPDSVLCEMRICMIADDIYHLDLKPENIFMGSDCQPRIIDFGQAVVAKENGVSPLRLKHG